MQLTDTWKQVIPARLQERYLFAETRSAAVILHATAPSEFADIVAVLDEFSLDLDKLFRPGGNKSAISEELDTLFRRKGWRESKFEQELVTTLRRCPWKEHEEVEQVTETIATSGAEGHKVDNVKGRVCVDVEWNPKDGNLDRDLANYIALNEGGVIDAGVLLIRSQDLREHTRALLKEVREALHAIDLSSATDSFIYRMLKTPKDPYGTSTTANFEKLVPRLERGDAQGCPVLAIGVSWNSYVSFAGSLTEELQKLAEQVSPHVPEARKAEIEKERLRMLDS